MAPSWGGKTVAAGAVSAQTGEGLVSLLVETDHGQIKMEIDTLRAPITSANFLQYVDDGFYSGGSFFRTVHMNNQPSDSIRIEVIQGGSNQDRRDELREPILLERTSETGLKHVDGAISMARGGPDTATSSFFICIADN